MVDHTVNGTKMTTTVSTVDDLLRARAAEEDQRPVVAYPKSNRGHNDHELFTAKQLHHFTNAAVRSYVASNLCPVVSPDPHKQKSVPRDSMKNFHAVPRQSASACSPGHLRPRLPDYHVRSNQAGLFGTHFVTAVVRRGIFVLAR